jgi:cytochrome c peroxidase
MHTKLVLFLALVLLGALVLYLVNRDTPAVPALAEVSSTPLPSTNSLEPIQPIPPVPQLDPAKVAAGERLFRDVRISHNNAISCNSCHHLDAAGVDGLKHSPRMDQTMAPMHTTTIFNVALNFRLFWDGRTKSLEEQIKNPRDTQTNWPEVLGKLHADPDYQAIFAKAYPGQGMTEATLADAVVTFERSLLTPGARFDRYLLGDTAAINEREKIGYRLFKSYGCSACHQGVNVGGNMYQKIGTMSDFFIDRPITDADLGRYKLTHNEADKHVFRVPSLRNVAVTPPYFHDGSVPTLRDAINEMAEHQLGRAIPPKDVQLILEFLQTLTGEYQGKPLRSDKVK